MKIKKAAAVIFALVLLLGLYACAEPPENNIPDHTVLAENEFADYTFCYPDDWTLDSNTSFISVIGGSSILYPEDKSISVMVSDLINTRTTPKEFWGQSKELLGNTFNDFAEVSTEESEIGGKSAYSVTYTAKVTDKVYKYAQSFITNRGAIYIITLTAMEADFEEAQKAYKTALETFKFK